MKYRLLMVLSALFWAGAFIAGKIAVSEIDPLTLTFIRFAVASICLVGILPFLKDKYKPDLKGVSNSFVLAVVGMVGYHLLFYQALRFTSSTSASIIAAMNPILTYLAVVVFLGGRKNGLKFTFVVISLMATILTLTNWKPLEIVSGGLGKGDVIMFAAVSLWVAYSLLLKKLTKGRNSIHSSFEIFFITAVVLLPFVDYSIIFNFNSLPQNVIISSIYMGIFPTVVGYMVQQMSTRAIGPENTNIFVNLVPVFTIAMAALILGEFIGTLQYISAFITILAIFMFNLTTTRTM